MTNQFEFLFIEIHYIDLDLDHEININFLLVNYYYDTCWSGLSDVYNL